MKPTICKRATMSGLLGLAVAAIPFLSSGAAADPYKFQAQVGDGSRFAIRSPYPGVVLGISASQGRVVEPTPTASGTSAGGGPDATVATVLSPEMESRIREAGIEIRNTLQSLQWIGFDDPTSAMFDGWAGSVRTSDLARAKYSEFKTAMLKLEPDTYTSGGVSFFEVGALKDLKGWFEKGPVLTGARADLLRDIQANGPAAAMTHAVASTFGYPPTIAPLQSILGHPPGTADPVVGPELLRNAVVAVVRTELGLDVLKVHYSTNLPHALAPNSPGIVRVSGDDAPRIGLGISLTMTEDFSYDRSLDDMYRYWRTVRGLDLYNDDDIKFLGLIHPGAGTSPDAKSLDAVADGIIADLESLRSSIDGQMIKWTNFGSRLIPTIAVMNDRAQIENTVNGFLSSDLAGMPATDERKAFIKYLMPRALGAAITERPQADTASRYAIANWVIGQFILFERTASGRVEVYIDNSNRWFGDPFAVDTYSLKGRPLKDWLSDDPGTQFLPDDRRGNSSKIRWWRSFAQFWPSFDGPAVRANYSDLRNMVYSLRMLQKDLLLQDAAEGNALTAQFRRQVVAYEEARQLYDGGALKSPIAGIVVGSFVEQDQEVGRSDPIATIRPFYEHTFEIERPDAQALSVGGASLKLDCGDQVSLRPRTQEKVLATDDPRSAAARLGRIQAGLRKSLVYQGTAYLDATGAGRLRAALTKRSRDALRSRSGTTSSAEAEFLQSLDIPVGPLPGGGYWVDFQTDLLDIGFRCTVTVSDDSTGLRRMSEAWRAVRP